MTVLVGLAPDAASAALPLAGLLARSPAQPLVVCTVVPAPWASAPVGVDAEYRSAVESGARAALDAAVGSVAALDPEVRVSAVLQHARSVPTGLLEVAARTRADLLVLGSSAAGLFGHVVLGSVSDRLLHSADLPVAVAPRGYRPPQGPLGRVSVAFDGSRRGVALVDDAAALAARAGVPLRIVSFALQRPTMLTAGVGPGAEREVVDTWTAQVVQAQQDAVRRVSAATGGAAATATAVTRAVGRGTRWQDALGGLDWRADEVLAVGSSSTGLAARVFLGSRAAKILRHAPVPVVVLPGAER